MKKPVLLLVCSLTLLLLGATLAPAADVPTTAAGLRAEGKLDPFLVEPTFELGEKIFRGQRLPNMLVATDGTLLAVWGWEKVWVRRSEDAGQSWGEPVELCKGIHSGGAVVDETDGDIFVFSEAKHPPAPLSVFRSTDHGKTWSPWEVEIKPDSRGNVPSMCMNEHGITLRHGEHAGRLLRPARWYAKGNNSKFYDEHYTTAIYSDDGGRTWNTSEPFPAFGTGEATLAELSDGRIYYNSRRHWAPKGENPRRRWTAYSEDGGESWRDLSICEVLPDGAQGGNYGLMGGLVRLPVEGRDILIFSNIESDGPKLDRKNGTVWASFDGGKTWPVKRLVTEGAFGYSSLASGRPGTQTEGWIFLGYEDRGLRVVRFNLSWLLDVGEGKAELTGDGSIPAGL